MRSRVISNPRLATALLVGAVMFMGVARSGQSSAARPAFEVASVKVNPAIDHDNRFGTIRHSPDTLTMRGISLWLSVRWAYGVGSFQISGPDWMQRPQLPFYDIVAKATGPVREAQMRMMLRSLLADRFHLAAHWEKKEMPVTALLVAKGGAKLHASTGKYDARQGPEAPLQFLGFDDQVHIQRTFDRGRLRDSYTNMPMNIFASLLELMASKTPYDKVPVVDMTGLRGRFDFALLMDRPAGGSREGEGGMPPDDPLADIKPFLSSELGLTLEHRRTAVEVLVIDHVDKSPTPN